MSFDPCLPPSAGAPVHHAPSRYLAHRIVGRIRHRHHASTSSAHHAASPAEACGKHFAPGQPGVLASRPTDGSPNLVAVHKAAALKGVAGASVASVLAATALLGALSLPGGSSLVATPPGSSLTAPAGNDGNGGSPGVSGGPGTTTGHPAPGQGTGSRPTDIPEPSSLALLLLAGWVIYRMRATQRTIAAKAAPASNL